MTDLIDRQAAIDAMSEALERVFPEHRQIAEKCINALPPAQPERKKGEWINRSLNIVYPVWERYTCSVCGKHSYSYDFCPNCGAKMGEEGKDD